MTNKAQRILFSSKIGIMSAAIGSAVGLGNIWKFPYIAHHYGGGAFILVYLFFIFAIGIPVMLSELMLGRTAQSNVVGVFKKVTKNPFWRIIGILGICTAFVIISFYAVVAGWSLEYLFNAMANNFDGKTIGEMNVMFHSFAFESFRPILWVVVFLLLTAGIILLGIRKGIEKYTKILMPLLFVLLVILAFKSLIAGSNKELLSFISPDFSSLSSEAILSALGHAFFTLSLGMGAIMTYGSYISKRNNLYTITIGVSVADTVIALLATVAIIPIVFLLSGPDISLKGPGLAFITLPYIFTEMTGGYFFSIMFFLLLVVAAVTSAISLLEVLVTFCIEELNMTRLKATVITSFLATLVGVTCALSQNNVSGFKVLGKNFFDLLDHLGSNILLPLSGLLIIIFTGWFLNSKVLKKELSNNGTLLIPYYKVYIFLAKYIVPIAIAVIFLSLIK